MPVGLRAAAKGFLSPVAVAALALGFAGPVSAGVPAPPNPNCSADNKCTALILGGTGTGTLTEEEMSEALNGYFADDAAYERLNVRYPGTWDFLTSIPIGSSLLLGEITTTEGPIVVGAFSQGASVANQVMVNLSINPKAPPKDQLRFVLVADPNHSPSASKWLVPETPYDVIAVTQEYDGFADYPDRWWNPIATFNATLGGLYLHFETVDVDLDTVPGENITVTVNSLDGVTTHYLVPTETLPLVKFMPFLAPLEGWLKEQVDAGYSRNDGKAEAVSHASFATVAADAKTAPESIDDEPQDVQDVEVDAADVSDAGDDSDSADSSDGGDGSTEAEGSADSSEIVPEDLDESALGAGDDEARDDADEGDASDSVDSGADESDGSATDSADDASGDTESAGPSDDS